MTFSTPLRIILPAILLALSPIPDVQAGWSVTQDMNEPRAGHTMTVLQDGRVLAQDRV